MERAELPNREIATEGKKEKTLADYYQKPPGPELARRIKLFILLHTQKKSRLRKVLELFLNQNFLSLKQVNDLGYYPGLSINHTLGEKQAGFKAISWEKCRLIWDIRGTHRKIFETTGYSLEEESLTENHAGRELREIVKKLEISPEGEKLFVEIITFRLKYHQLFEELTEFQTGEEEGERRKNLEELAASLGEIEKTLENHPFRKRSGAIREFRTRYQELLRNFPQLETDLSEWEKKIEDQKIEKKPTKSNLKEKPMEKPPPEPISSVLDQIEEILENYGSTKDWMKNNRINLLMDNLASRLFEIAKESQEIIDRFHQVQKRINNNPLIPFCFYWEIGKKATD